MFDYLFCLHLCALTIKAPCSKITRSPNKILVFNLENLIADGYVRIFLALKIQFENNANILNEKMAEIDICWKSYEVPRAALSSLYLK